MDPLPADDPKRPEQTLRIAPVLITEGVRSPREAARAGSASLRCRLGWCAKMSPPGRLVRVLPRWNAADIPIHVIYQRPRVLPARVRAFVELAVKHTDEMQVGG